MAVYIVTWNINKAGASYNAARDIFLGHLANCDNTSDPSLETVRFVSTTITADELSNYLQQKLDKNDRLFVSRLDSGRHQGWLGRETWDWINARL